MVALITGATSGIGEELAYLYAEKKVELVLVARSEIKLKNLQQQIEKQYNINVHVLVIDLVEVEQINRIVEYLEIRQLKLDYLINNAGIGHYGLFNEQELVKDLETIDLNVKSLTYISKMLYPFLNPQGKVLQVASTAAFAPGPYMGVYYASKAYVVSLGMALRSEWKSEGKGVCVLCPGPTATPFIDKAKMRKSKLASKSAMTPKEVAWVAYRGLERNKAIIVPGILNKLSVMIMRHLPLELSTLLVRSTQR